MKKIYIIPSLEVLEDIETDIICASTDPEEGRYSDLDGVSPDVNTTEEGYDPSTGGRGEGGYGNRAKGGGYTAWGISWDDDEF